MIYAGDSIVEALIQLLAEDGEFTLMQLAQWFGVTYQTARRRMQQSGIKGHPIPEDPRVRVLTKTDVATLLRSYGVPRQRM